MYRIHHLLYITEKIWGVGLDDDVNEEGQEIVGGAGLHCRCHRAKDLAAVHLWRMGEVGGVGCGV
jgi:hypothetical protein